MKARSTCLERFRMQETVMNLLCRDKMISISNHVPGVTLRGVTKVTRVRAVPLVLMLIHVHLRGLRTMPARVL